MCLGETAGSGLITSGRWLIYRCESTYDFVNLFHFLLHQHLYSPLSVKV
jgi:hypothetical protein